MPGSATTDDEVLLREYASTRSPEAFAELARRHADWVYSTASRMLRNADLAHDVTQAVFLLLSQQPRKALGRKLPAWLFHVTRFTVANTLRAETRRRKHELQAASNSHATIMSHEPPDPDPETLWKDLSPLLDDFLARLRFNERQVLLLRYYLGKSLAEVGQYLGISEEAARKRVNYSVDKLREMFASRGFVAMGAAFSGGLLAKSTQAAPASLVSAIATPGAQSVSATVLAAAVDKFLFLAKLKTAAVILLFALIPFAAVGAIFVATREPSLASTPPALSVAAPAGAPTVTDIMTAPARGAAPAPPINAQTMKYPVNFQLGSSQLAPGDKLSITEIRGSADAISAGNSYLIKGAYTLASQPEAVLAVNITSTQRGVNDNGPYGNNVVNIKKGSGTFALELRMNITGYPHLSFYPTNGGGWFGNLYFGTGQYVYK
jgi:RNA polymerase sigma factor (sigma-70 family)